MERPGGAVHRTIVVVDVESFGDQRRNNQHQISVREGLYRAVQKAFDVAGLPWADCYHEDRGDAVFILVPPQLPKAALVDSVPLTLVAALGEHNTSHPVEARIRLRMAVHAGEVVHDDYGVTATSVNLAFRLLDAKPLKAALAESAGVLAVVTSGWFFDEVVRHSRYIDPATFRPVRVTVKETSTVGWISRPDHPYVSDPVHLTAPPPGPPAELVPHQLRAAPRSFTGRTRELATLTAELDHATGRGPTVVISAGAGGIGKTWLVMHWAQAHLDRFPDGQLFVDLRGFGPDDQPMSTGAAIRGFLDAFGVGPAQIPVDPHAQVARYRSVVAGKRMLIVLDNAADTTQVTPLLPGSPSCTVVITSRNHLTGLVTGHGAQHLPVDTLTDAEARALLTTRLGEGRVAAEPAAVDELVACCAGFPLALSIVAGRAHTTPSVPLAELAAELREAWLGALDDDDPTASMPTVLSWSYHSLGPEQARMFALLGIAPGPDISLGAAASIAGLPTAAARIVLRGLEQASLVSRGTSGRWRMHDLIRRYAVDRADHDQTEAERDAALHRVVDFYLHTAQTGSGLLVPTTYEPAIPFAPPAPGCTPDAVGDPDAALEWFNVEYHCLLATEQLAMTRDWDTFAWQLAWVMQNFRLLVGHLDDNLSAWRAALIATERRADPQVRGWTHGLLGIALTHVRQYVEAHDHLTHALDAALRFGAVGLEAHVHNLLAWNHEQAGDDDRALEHASRSLRLCRALNLPMGEAHVLSVMGRCHLRAGRYEDARKCCDAALALHRERADRFGEAEVLDILGDVDQHAGSSNAITHYHRAVDLHQALGFSYAEAGSLDRLGQAYLTAGQHDRARTMWRQSCELYRAQQRITEAERVQRRLNDLDRSGS